MAIVSILSIDTWEYGMFAIFVRAVRYNGFVCWDDWSSFSYFTRLQLIKKLKEVRFRELKWLFLSFFFAIFNLVLYMYNT